MTTFLLRSTFSTFPRRLPTTLSPFHRIISAISRLFETVSDHQHTSCIPLNSFRLLESSRRSIGVIAYVMFRVRIAPTDPFYGPDMQHPAASGCDENVSLAARMSQRLYVGGELHDSKSVTFKYQSNSL